MGSLEQSCGCFEPHSMLNFGCFLNAGNAPPAPTHLSGSETTLQGPCRKNGEKLPEVRLRCHHGQMWEQQALLGVQDGQRPLGSSCPGSRSAPAPGRGDCQRSEVGHCRERAGEPRWRWPGSLACALVLWPHIL